MPTRKKTTAGQRVGKKAKAVAAKATARKAVMRKNTMRKGAAQKGAAQKSAARKGAARRQSATGKVAAGARVTGMKAVADRLPGLSPVVTPWPKGYRSACLFTFDVDAEVSWVFRGISEPIALSMGRFESKVGMPLLLNLLAKYDIKSTFFVPGWVAEKYRGMVESILRGGHDVEHHGQLHEPPTTFTSAAQEEEALLKGIETLQRITGRRPRAYRSPFWEFSENTIPLLAKHGFDYTGDLMDTLLPDYHIVNGRRVDMINLPGHWILDDLAHFYYHISARKTILSCRQVLELYQEEFRGIRAYGGLFTLTMHPQASGRPSRVLMLQQLMEYVRSFSDVWVTSPAEMVEYWRKAHPVAHSMAAE
jgi:peptidoglycan/xylan/chitin deacetylase (PgdA/CDA1 family)